LARSNFPAFALATVPGAISALTHCILGSLIAGLCRLCPAKDVLQESLKLGEQESAG
ncbi:MAG: hypothetical protein HZA02_07515, partial [Nitrospinae bacterium]|nr:hypothetical protein [Nitrospinota bacterium]